MAPPPAEESHRPPWRDPLLGAALAAALPVWAVLVWLQPPAAPLAGAVAAPLTFLYLVLALPILEEAAFRGLVQEGLGRLWRRRWGPLTAANAGQAAAFGLLHLISQPPLWAAAVLFPGLVFGFFRERHATLATPIALHAFYNGGFFLLYPP
ncbi:JDVT-CTERM system glutamic-type intramembrane protease MrtJ [Thiohalorhabdus sp.]|uniref:JDVT-CTERM system glutamic-type intramembrane protease MrtJ n=1 Tax=Thiohalorhabdus sp. TaxID=3094134 RepID=UPI002FC37A40